jgi:hypothetical protein
VSIFRRWLLWSTTKKLLRIYAAGLLEEHGFSVLEADSSTTALEILDSRKDAFDYFLPIFKCRAAWMEWTGREKSMPGSPMSVW